MILIGYFIVMLRKLYMIPFDVPDRDWNIVKIMSIYPETMKTSMEMYQRFMISPSPLNRTESEKLAVVVSSKASSFH